MKPALFIAFFFLCIVSAVHTKAQTYTYYLNNDLVSVDRKDATIIGKGIKENNRFKLDCYSVKGNQLYLTLYCTDSTLTVLNGPFTSYHLNNTLAETGSYTGNMKDGSWQKWDTTGLKTDSAFYKDDKEIFTATFNYHSGNKMLSYRSYKDSLKNTLQTFSYDSSGVLTKEINFIGERGIEKIFKGTEIVTDSLFTREEVEATFRGSDREWKRYIEKNLDVDVPIKNGARAGIYTVIVKFIILPDGKVGHVVAETKHGYGMEKEAARVIKNSPPWKPAMQYGKYVNAYRRQPLTFYLSNN